MKHREFKTIDHALQSIPFNDKGLRELAEQELLRLRTLEKNVQVYLDPSGFAVYNLGNKDFVLATVHNGIYVPDGIPFHADASERHTSEEDILTGELYMPLFLDLGGVWLNTFVSRYFADLNRPKPNSILSCGADKGEKNFERFEGDNKIIQAGENYYDSFYGSLAHIILPGSFVFSGHSMLPEKDGEKRGDFCLIYKSDEEGTGLKRSLEQKGFHDIRINDPFRYSGGFFRLCADCLNADHTNTSRSVEFETNKRLYLKDDLLTKSDSFEDVSRRITHAVKECLQYNPEL
ncbi:MAG: N-formylglutamate amidohydrolase [Nanoarchaeota archaeon]|nr:N-formylglutamate amidohydrolase [Nanoarchaeota archaeon]